MSADTLAASVPVSVLTKKQARTYGPRA